MCHPGLGPGQIYSAPLFLIFVTLQNRHQVSLLAMSNIYFLYLQVAYTPYSSRNKAQTRGCSTLLAPAAVMRVTRLHAANEK